MGKKILQNSLLVLGSLLFSFGIAEIALRLAGLSFPVFTRQDLVLGEWHIPHAEGWSAGEGDAYIRINSDGMRDREHAIVKPQGTFRIAVLGDSYAEAKSIDAAKTFWAELEHQLTGCPALSGHPVEVLNFGLGGNGTAEELLVLRHRVWKYDPDLVLLAFFIGNDFRNNTKELQKGNRPYFIERNGQLELDNSYQDGFGTWLRGGPIGQMFTSALPYSRALQLVVHGYEEARRSAKIAERRRQEERNNPVGDLTGNEIGLDHMIYIEPTDPDWQKAWRITEELLQKMAEEVEMHGADFVIATISTGIQVHPDPQVRARFAERLGISDLYYPDARLEQYALGQGISLVRLAPPLRQWAENNKTCVHGYQNAVPCGGHWNEHGHREAGRLIADKVCGMLQARR